MNNSHKGTMVIGIVLVIIGVLFLLSNFGIFQIYFDIFDVGFLFSHFWPLFLIIPGIIFQYSFFTAKTPDAGLLVPGGILLVSGFTCQIAMLFDLWAFMWPGFVLSVAVGLFELYVLVRGKKGF